MQVCVCVCVCVIPIQILSLQTNIKSRPWLLLHEHSLSSLTLCHQPWQPRVFTAVQNVSFSAVPCPTHLFPTPPSMALFWHSTQISWPVVSTLAHGTLKQDCLADVILYIAQYLQSTITMKRTRCTSWQLRLSRSPTKVQAIVSMVLSPSAIGCALGVVFVEQVLPNVKVSVILTIVSKASEMCRHDSRRLCKEILH